MTLFKKLAVLASKLDEYGHVEEANEVDKILKHLMVSMPKCTCKCDNCECELEE
jgi:hypothetical protein